MPQIASKKILALPLVADTGVVGTDAAPVVASGVTSRMSMTSWALVIGRLFLPAGVVVSIVNYLTNNRVYNVKDYGALGDGVANDGTAIRLAQTNAALVKGTVYFPPGTYNWAGDLIPSPGAQWIGGGKRQYSVKLKAIDSTAKLAIGDSAYLKGFAMYGSVSGSPFVGTGVQIGTTDFAGHIVLEDFYVVNFQTGLRLGAALWTTINRSQFEHNRIGVDYNAIDATHYSNAITFNDCVAAFNDRNGVGATYTPIGNSSFFWIGGSIEGNGSENVALYPQLVLGNCQHFVIRTYLEYGGGPKPKALDLRGCTDGDIQVIVFSSSDAIFGDSTSKYLTIHNSRFVGTTNKMINMPGAYQVLEYANEFDLAASTNVLPAYIYHADFLFDDATYDIGKSFANRPRDGFFSRNVVVGAILSAFGGLEIYRSNKQGRNTVTVSTGAATDVYRLLSEVGAVLNTSMIGQFWILAIDVANGANQTLYMYDFTTAANLVGDAVLTQTRRYVRGTDTGVSATPFTLVNDGVGGAVKLQFTKNAAIANVRVEVLFKALETV